MVSELWRRYRYEGSTDAREELIIRCLPMVKALARRFSAYAAPCCGYDDFVSAGIVGLLEALDRYNPDMKTSFMTYAKHRIRGAILDELRSLEWMPRSIHEKVRRLERTYAALEKTLARSPSEEELADALGMDVHQFREMLTQIGAATVAAMAYRPYEEENTDPIEYPNGICPIDQIISDEMRTIVANAIRSLPERKSMVITLYYYEEMTMREIGEVLSCTGARISQIYSSALMRLFKVLRSQMTEPGTSRRTP